MLVRRFASFVGLVVLLCSSVAFSQSVVFQAGFEGSLAGWQATNDNNSEYNWVVLQNVPGPQGGTSRVAGVATYFAPPGQYALVSPAFTIPVSARLEFEFDLAYAPRPEVGDSLTVIVRIGDESFVVAAWEGEEFATASPTSESFVPSGASDWRREMVDLSIYASRTQPVSGRIGFIARSGFDDGQVGNNMFVDNLVVRILPVEDQLAGREGWRLLAPPAANADYDDILAPLRTAGFPGADNPSGKSNVFGFDEDAGVSDAGLFPPSSITAEWPVGTGRLVYAFDDEGPGSLPVTIVADGPGVPLPFSIPASYSGVDAGSSEYGWNLGGNPFSVSFDWDEALRSNVDHTVYVWDPNASGGGRYLTWNTVVGSLEDGVLAPFQGFWFKANAPSPQLQATKASRVLGGELLGRPAVEMPVVRLHASATVDGVEFDTEFFTMLTEDASSVDHFTGYELEPLSDDYLILFGMDDEGTGLSIASRLEPEEELLIPIGVEALRHGISTGASVTLTWDVQNPEESFDVALIDADTGTSVDLAEQTEYSLTISPTGSVTRDGQPFSNRLVVERDLQDATRLMLQITRRPIASEPVSSVGSAPELEAAFPNPFAESSSVLLTLPSEAIVTAEVFDILGRSVARVLDNGHLSAGSHRLEIDGRDLASGVYLVHVRVRTDQGEEVLTRRMARIAR